MRLKPFLVGFGILAILLTLIPLFTANYWWIRVFDFPHVQLTVLTFSALVVYFLRFNFRDFKDDLFVTALIACFIFQLIKIFPYTPFASYQLEKPVAEATFEKNISLFVANVLQENDDYDKVLGEINKKDPDLVLLMETNEKWKDNISEKFDSYPYKVELPLENTYGMLLYSKLKLINPEVKFLIADSIPSIHSKVELRSGNIINMMAIHPEPPTPQHNPKSTDRDGEMMLIAKKAKESKLPVLVIGDFNDVAWSETTSSFQKTSGLLDPRIGRGFYSTYHANNFLLRWPLDHVFVSPEFRLVEITRGKNIGSDHFPIYGKFALEAQHKESQELPDPDKEEKEDAEKEIIEATY